MKSRDLFIDQLSGSYIGKYNSFEPPLNIPDADTFGFSWTPPLTTLIRPHIEQVDTVDFRYNEKLRNDQVFLNPKSVYLMATSYGIDSCSFGRITTCRTHSEWNYQTLKTEQNSAWAEQCLKKGISLARSEDYKGALAQYDVALGVCPDHVKALVAKGAALANISDFEASVECLDAALAIDPHDKNAVEYAEEIRKRLPHNISLKGTISKLEQLLSPGEVSDSREGVEASQSSDTSSGFYENNKRRRSSASPSRRNYSEKKHKKNKDKDKKKHKKLSKDKKEKKKKKRKRSSQVDFDSSESITKQRDDSSALSSSPELHPILQRQKNKLWNL
eukprot:gene2469-4791_t